MNNTVVAVSHLTKEYNKVKAVDDVSFTVGGGEIFGILGPNGAGKTTTVECIAGLNKADSGRIDVLGYNPQADRATLRRLVGVQLQSSSFQDKLKVVEILDLYASFYPNPANSKELADGLGLNQKLDSYYKTLSGGQKQRLSVALALIGNPKVAVLDEMTTGLDPQARLNVWELIEQFRNRGTTIILVTHFMEEAERLCDRLALIDKGQVIALNSPRGLADDVAGGKQVRFTPSAPFDETILTDLPNVKAVEHKGKHIQVVGSGQLVNDVILTLRLYDIDALDVQLNTATLEDAFVALTGRHLHEDTRGDSK